MAQQVPDYLTETELEALANDEICGAIDEQSLELPLENLAIDTLFQPPCLVSLEHVYRHMPVNPTQETPLYHE